MAAFVMTWRWVSTRARCQPITRRRSWRARCLLTSPSPIARACFPLACVLASPLLDQLGGREAGRLVLLLEDGRPATRMNCTCGRARRCAASRSLRKQLPLLLEKLLVRAGVIELRLQLSELAALQPQQLSLFDVSREGRSLRAAVDAWRRRFHQTVYQLSLTDVPRHFPPALQFESEALGA